MNNWISVKDRLPDGVNIKIENECYIPTNNSLEQREYFEQLARGYADKALSEATRRAYRSDFAGFVRYCEQREISAMPALPQTIAGFLAHEAERGIKPASLDRKLAAINTAHLVRNYESPAYHKIVKSVLSGIKHDKGTAPDRKSPATVERIIEMISHCPDTLTGKRDKALLLFGFAGAFRRSELVSLKVSDLEFTAEGVKVLIRKSKTDQEGYGQIIGILNGTRLHVVDILVDWLHAAHIKNGYIFRRIFRWDTVGFDKLSPQSVALIIKHYAAKIGLTINQFSGHSLRSGFITSSARHGASLTKIMEVTRHRTVETVLEYIRESNLFEDHAGKDFL